jgi:hypothetical protein
MAGQRLCFVRVKATRSIHYDLMPATLSVANCRMLACTLQGSAKRRVQERPYPKEGRMRRAVLVLVFGMFGARAEVLGAECSSYYISEINIVSVADTEAGNVQTYVGFGLSKEESEKNAVGACSHLRFDLQTCLESDRSSGRNAVTDSPDNSLHLKYMNAVKRVTGCS